MVQFVTCTNRKGLVLRGLLHKPDTANEKLPIVILFHGFCGEKCEVNFVHSELSRILCDLGIACIRFDFSGSGDSDGEFEDMTPLTELDDALSILDYVKTLDFVDTKRIALHGLSMGGLIASLTAGTRPDEICALSMWCPAASLVYEVRNLKICNSIDISAIKRDGVADIEGLRLGSGFYDACFKFDPYEIAANFKGPVNIVHGDADITVPMSASLRYKEVYGDRANLLIVPGANHRFISFSHKKQRFDSAVSFLKSQLLAND